jgi:hypothetical protein
LCLQSGSETGPQDFDKTAGKPGTEFKRIALIPIESGAHQDPVIVGLVSDLNLM